MYMSNVIRHEMCLSFLTSNYIVFGIGIYMDNIFFVNISKNPNLKVIVQKLFSHKGDDRPEFQSDEDAINQLEQLLNQIGPNPILLILDDVWPGSVSLIEKFQFNIQNYKIVVTSRTAFPRFKFRYNLNPLNHEDAMTLFRHSAALQDGSSDIPEEDIEKVLCQCVNIYIPVYGMYLHFRILGMACI